MTDVDLSWMNVPGPDGLTWAQKNSGDLSWMNTPGPDGLSFIQKYERNELPGQSAAAPALTDEQQRAWYELTSILRSFNLESMAEPLKAYIIANGTDDKTRLRLWIYDQPQFKERFPALEALKNKNRAISPEEYIQLEKQYQGVMRTAGLSSDFFDNPNDFTDLISNEVTPDEFRIRVENGYNKVANTDPLVREAFKNYFGIQGDQALASFFIDPEKSAPALLKAAAAAEIGATAYAQDLDIDLNYATKLAEQGVTYQQAMEGMRRVSQLSSLFAGGINETNVVSSGVAQSNLPSNLAINPRSREIGIAGNQLNTDQNSNQLGAAGSKEDQLGVDFVFGTNRETQKQLELRLAKRKAQASGVSQQVSANREGQTAIGTAD